MFDLQFEVLVEIILIVFGTIFKFHLRYFSFVCD